MCILVRFDELLRLRWLSRLALGVLLIHGLLQHGEDLLEEFLVFRSRLEALIARVHGRAQV